MPNPRMKQRRVVHKSTAGILKPIPEAVDLVGNPPPGSAPATSQCEPPVRLHARLRARIARPCDTGGTADHTVSVLIAGSRSYRLVGPIYDL
jgi:hypothetical protein